MGVESGGGVRRLCVPAWTGRSLTLGTCDNICLEGKGMYRALANFVRLVRAPERHGVTSGSKFSLESEKGREYRMRDVGMVEYFGYVRERAVARSLWWSGQTEP